MCEKSVIDCMSELLDKAGGLKFECVYVVGVLLDVFNFGVVENSSEKPLKHCFSALRTLILKR